MQDLFSKVNREKRHLYGENGILGHRRAISTTVPTKTTQGHRRTYSNTSSDFKIIFEASPDLLKIVEKPKIFQTQNKKKEPLIKSLNESFNYFISKIVPKELQSKNEKIKNEIIFLTETVSGLTKNKTELMNQIEEINTQLIKETEINKDAENDLKNLKKKTNDLELALKSTQEQLKQEKNITNKLVGKIESNKKDNERNLYTSLQLSTKENSSTNKYLDNFSKQLQQFPLTPTTMHISSKSGYISPL